jgi:uncharacterized protein YecT (DUF1311 family)
MPCSGNSIERSLDTVTVREAARDRVENPGGPAIAYIRFAKGERIQFRTISNSNPKALENVRTYCALFQGTYDFAGDRWIVTDARPISAQMFDILSEAYANSSFGTDQTAIRFGSEQEKAEYYDRQLNEVYSALRFILPKNEFEKIKAEQIAWLKQRDAAPSLEEKNERLQARVKALRDLLW